MSISFKQMKEELYENIFGAYVDDGMDEDELTNDELDNMSDSDIISQYNDMVSDEDDDEDE